MKLINPYPDFTVEQIKLLNDNIKFNITNHGHSSEIEFLGMHIGNPYYSNENSELNKNIERAVLDILGHTYFLSLQLEEFENMYKRYCDFNEQNLELIKIESGRYLTFIRTQILSILSNIVNSNKRIWPVDILKKLNISFENVPHLYDDYCMSLYKYIDGFETANGKKINSKVSIEEYVNTDKDVKTIIKAIDFICEKCKPYLPEIALSPNISNYQRKLQLLT